MRKRASTFPRRIRLRIGISANKESAIGVNGSSTSSIFNLRATRNASRRDCGSDTAYGINSPVTLFEPRAWTAIAALTAESRPPEIPSTTPANPCRSTRSNKNCVELCNSLPGLMFNPLEISLMAQYLLCLIHLFGSDLLRKSMSHHQDNKTVFRGND